MATSPNYAWAEPDNSSLVKNGASDIRTLGDAIDTSLWNVGFGQAAKNKIINGDFNINQRNLTSTTTNNIYGFDRWNWLYSGGTATWSAQTFTTGAAPVAGYESKNFSRIVTSGQSGTGDYAFLGQRIESVRTFAGQTVTISFWAKASTGTPKVGISLEQSFGSGGSSGVIINAGNVTISSSWARYSVTVAIPSISGKTIGTGDFLILEMWTSAGSALSAYTGIGVQNATIDIWGVQVEYGSKATPFQTATGTIQGELAACQRYYWRQTAPYNYSNFGNGFGTSTTNAMFQIKTPVTMRTATSPAIEGSNIAVYDGTTVTATTSLTLTGSQNGPDIFTVTGNTASGLTNFRPYALIANNNTSAYLAISQEL